MSGPNTEDHRPDPNAWDGLGTIAGSVDHFANNRDGVWELATAQPSPDLPDSLRRDRLPVGEDLYREAAEAYQAAFPNPVGGSSVALTAADMRLRAAVDRVVELVRAECEVTLTLMEGAATVTINGQAADLAAMTARAEEAEAMARDCDVDERTIDGLADTAARLARQLKEQRDLAAYAVKAADVFQNQLDRRHAKEQQLAADVEAHRVARQSAEARYDQVRRRPEGLPADGDSSPEPSSCRKTVV
jgi:hypothetical protein